MKASYPYYNPERTDLPGHDLVCTVESHQRKGKVVNYTFAEHGAKVVRADLIYTLNAGDKYEEWFRTPAELTSGTTASVELPAGTTHYYLNLVDENNFLVSYPAISPRRGDYSKSALSVNGNL